MYSTTVNVFHICSKLDWIIFFLSLILTLISVFIGKKITKVNAKKSPTNNKFSLIDYLLMGRKLTLPLFIATLVSTWYGNIFGVAQISFEHGIYNFITQGAFWYISYFIFAWFLVKKIRNSNALTLPDLIEKVIGPKSARLSCILIFIKTIPISLAISLGIFLQLLFPINFYLATFLGIIFIIIYSNSGGLRNIVFSDAIQFIFMYLGIIAVIVFSYSKFGGLSYLKSSLPASYFKPTGDYSWPYTFVWFFIAITTTFVNPTFYQRCFAAQNYKIARNGIFFAIIIWFIFDICITLGGMYAKAAIPDANPTNGYLVYSLQLLPNGFRGLLLASILATILSTLDSFMFLASNILFYDLKVNFIKDLKLRHIVAMLIVAASTLAGAFLIEGKIEILWRTFRGYYASCLIMPFLISCLIKVINKKINLKKNMKLNFVNSNIDNTFVRSCITGILCVSIWDIFNVGIKFGFDNFDSFYVGVIATTLSMFFWYTRSNQAQKSFAMV